MKVNRKTNLFHGDLNSATITGPMAFFFSTPESMLRIVKIKESHIEEKRNVAHIVTIDANSPLYTWQYCEETPIPSVFSGEKYMTGLHVQRFGF